MAFTTIEACKEECTKTEGCVAFTTVAGTSNKCHLKRKDHAAEAPNAIAISARMSCYEGNIEKQLSPQVILMCHLNWCSNGTNLMILQIGIVKKKVLDCRAGLSRT